MSKKKILSSYVEKTVRCILECDLGLQSGEIPIEIGKEYEVKITNIKHPGKIPIVGYVNVFSPICFVEVENRNQHECYPGVMPVLPNHYKTFYFSERKTG